jgi:nicotinate phosphoribosyltransferase
VFRGSGGDVVGLRDEVVPDDHEPMLVPVMRGGMRTGPHRTLETARALFRSDLERVPESARTIEDPVAPVPAISKPLDELYERTRADALKRAGL